MLGGEYGALFWSGSWYYVAAFLFVIVVIDFYFIYNWKLFTLLESEQWKELETYLNGRMKPGKVPPGFIVRIMINASMMNGNLEAVERLGIRVREKKPALFKKLLLSFSLPVLLESNPEKMEAFFKPYRGEGEWTEYLYAFSLLLQKKTEDALLPLIDLCSGKISPVLLLLTIYSLSAAAENPDERKCLDEKKSKLKTEYTRETFNIEIEKERSHVIAAVLSKLIDDAVNWLFE